MEPKSVDRIFWDALELTSPEDCAAFLDRQCGGDIDLRQKLEQLLKARAMIETCKALEKDRALRYETATALTRDIERHLAGDAVEAGPPSGSYRLKRPARPKQRSRRRQCSSEPRFASNWQLTRWGGTARSCAKLGRSRTTPSWPICEPHRCTELVHGQPGLLTGTGMRIRS